MMRKVGIVLLIIVLLIVPYTGFTAVRINPDKLYKSGIEAYNKNNYDEAKNLLNKAINNGLKEPELSNARQIIKLGSSETRLFLASQKGNLNIVQALIAAKADVNAKDVDGNNSLHWAAKGGHKEVVELLKNAGAVD